MIEQAKLKFQQPAVPLDNLLSSHTNSDDDDDAVVPEEFQLVSVEGFFVFDEEMTVGPRSRGPAGREASGGLISKPQAGYFVYCPFITRSGLKILVNRGWVPYDMKDRHKRESLVDHDAKGQNQVVSIVGTWRYGENPQAFPANDPQKNQWYSIDLKGMANHTKSSAVLVDLVAGFPTNDLVTKIPGAPLPRGLSVNLPNNHLSYAITWFGLSAFSAAMLML